MRPFHYISLTFLLLLLVWGYARLQANASWWYPVVLTSLYFLLLTLGAIYIRWNFYLKSYHSGVDKKAIALTFDDGPGAETKAILDILKAEKVLAAFFYIGKNAAGNPSLVLQSENEGHLLCNHSYHHGFNFDWQSTGRMAAELEQTNNTIKQITGKRPRLFRPPYGVTNPSLAKAARFSGMVSIGWSIRSFDTTAKDPEKLLQRILTQIKGGDILLLHDTMPITRQLLPELIRMARAKGFTFVRLDELLQLEPYA